MSAIEVLKNELLYVKEQCVGWEYGFDLDRANKAIEQALLALEQKEKLKVWLEKEINSAGNRLKNAQLNGNGKRQSVSMTRIKVLREVKELINEVGVKQK